MKKLLLSVSILFFIVCASVAQPCNMSGVYKIGTGGAYPTLTAALNTLRTNGVSGPVILELDTNYNSTAETFPLNFNNIPCLTAIKNLTVRPVAGATGLIIDNFNTVISLANSRYITIDGRSGGTGFNIELTISSASPNGTILFSNDASFNTIKYTNILGSASAVNAGTISFTTSNQSITNGNNNNLIYYCEIADYFGGTPAIAVSSVGSNGKKNANNRISNCLFKDYANFSGAKGIYLGANSSSWQIDSNSFFHTSAIYNSNAILINDTTSSGFQIIGNYIGGTLPQCFGNADNALLRYTGIRMAVGKQGYSSVQGNVIANINWSNNTSSDAFTAIHLIAGKIRCGDIAGNTIGSFTQNASIHTTSFYLTSPLVTGILIGYNLLPGTLDSIIVKNNMIGGIKCEPDANNYLETELRAIYVKEQAAGHVTISNNQIGSPTLEKSLESTEWNGDYSTRGIDVEVAVNGPLFQTYPIANIVSGNIITHLSGQIRAINLSGGKPVVKNNLIKDLLSELITSNGFIPVIIGINAIYTLPGTLISENTIHTCSLKGLYGASVIGITADFATGLEISKNNMHSFQSEPPTAMLAGIFIVPELSMPAHGNFKINNNMICLGVDTSGNIINQLNEIRGIIAPLDTTVITHNSVYISAGAGDNESSALYLNASGNSPCRITNNILINLRTVQGVNFYRHYVMLFNASITTLSQLNSNYNIFQNGGSQNYLGSFNNVLSADLIAWQTNTGLDLNSFTGNPNFKSPLGTSQTSDLHLNLPTIADATGINEPTILYDIDNELRSLLTPVDIGADAPNANPNAIIENANEKGFINVYPNPSYNFITIKIKNATSKTTFKIYNSTMQLIKTIYFESGIENQISLSDFTNGIYFIDAQSGGQSYKTKFMVSR